MTLIYQREEIFSFDYVVGVGGVSVGEVTLVEVVGVVEGGEENLTYLDKKMYPQHIYQ